MTVHWHDDECTWCPCDEVTTGDPQLVAAWFQTIRHRVVPEPTAAVEPTTGGDA